jgi:cytochrome b
VSKNNRLVVWDLPVRCLHWMLVASVALAWATSSQTGVAHEYIGYAAATIVLTRLVWGFKGHRYARFAQFVRPPTPTLQYLREVAGARAARYLGHNPLGGWMVVALLACLVFITVTGWIATTDMFWGYAWPVRLHSAIAWLLVLLIILHVAGILLTSFQHRENLVAAMFTGKKDKPQPGDID